MLHRNIVIIFVNETMYMCINLACSAYGSLRYVDYYYYYCYYYYLFLLLLLSIIIMIMIIIIIILKGIKTCNLVSRNV